MTMKGVNVWVGECFFWYRLNWVVKDKIHQNPESYKMVVGVCLHGCWWLLVAAVLKQWQHPSCGDGCPVWAGGWEERRCRNWAGRCESTSIRTRALHLRQLVSIAENELICYRKMM